MRAEQARSAADHSLGKRTLQPIGEGDFTRLTPVSIEYAVVLSGEVTVQHIQVCFLVETQRVGMQPAPCRATKLSKETAFKRCSKKTMDILRIILAIILPPVGVFLQVGFGVQFWINILLTLLGYLPGIIHALYVIIKVK